jgi:site-specific DNA recombinase
MYRDSVPLVPRNGHTLHVGIVARISGCEDQTELSNEDQIDHFEEIVDELYDGEVEYHTISTIGKGERLDRVELAQIEALLREKKLDLLGLEDLGRMVRGTEAVRLCGIAVDHGVRVISANDGVDTADPGWEADAIDACKEHVGHNYHTSRRIKHKKMNRFLKFGGAPALPIYGYVVPEEAKTYDAWQKMPEAEPIYREAFERLWRTLNTEAVADWFNETGVPVGPYCRRKTWNGKMIRRLFRNTLLKGKPGRGHRKTIKHHESGRRVSVPNPDGARYRDCPHLAFFTEEEFDALNARLDEKNRSFGRKKVNGQDPFVGVPRKRTRFPGQHARCYYCGRHYVWGGNGVTENLMCCGSRELRCWNSVGFNGELAARKLLDAVLKGLDGLEGFDDQFAEMVRIARREVDGDHPERWAQLQRDEATLARQQHNMVEAIKQFGPSDLLRTEMADLDQRKRALLTERRRLESLRAAPLDLSDRLLDLRLQLRDEFGRLAVTSPEFGDLMRLLAPEFCVYLVRLCDGGHPLPRARVRINLAGNLRGIDRVPSVKTWFDRDWTIDLFKATQRETIRTAAVQINAESPKLTYDQIADEIDKRLHELPTSTAVGYALALQRRMEELGLDQPYVILREPPADYAKLRRHKNVKYRFEPTAAWAPPPIG